MPESVHGHRRAPRPPSRPPLGVGCRPEPRTDIQGGRGLNRRRESGLSGRECGDACWMANGGRGAFAGADPVSRYWEARCLGFEVLTVRGRAVGLVEGLELDRDSGSARLLLVRRRSVFGRTTLRVRPESVSALDPWRRSLVVTLPRRTSPVRRAGSVSRPIARGTRIVGISIVRIARGAPRTVPSAVRQVRRGGRPAVWAARRASFAAALAAWIYAVAVVSVVRVCARLVLAAAVGACRAGRWGAPRAARASRRAAAALRERSSSALRPAR